MTEYDFTERLKFSLTSNGQTFEDIISNILPNTISVTKTDTAIDRTGVDYISTLKGGIQVKFDLKLRDKGCSVWWKNGEEIALEIWSVIPDSHHIKGKVGWTLDSKKATHYTLHAFDKSDSDKIFIFPFQLLRKSFRINFNNWSKIYKHAIQSSREWESECLFVPASIVIKSIQDVMTTKRERCLNREIGG